MDGDPTTYERRLREAYELGRRDGRAAAPSQRRPGRLPAGLPLNGPHWYAAGFRAGLLEQAAGRVPTPRRPAPRAGTRTTAD